ncbi:MAG: hypothetical protein MSJ26_05280 [Oscillospiraceae bacterium]|nr:hypothetical protein [Oscillospiraceae bacterium]
MDELKMEGLELPDTGESYDDMPDASEGLLEDNPRPSFAMGGPEDFSDMDIPEISNLDGTDFGSPAKQEDKKPVSLEKPAEQKPMFEDMGGAAAKTGHFSSSQSNFQERSGTYSAVNNDAAQSSVPSYGAAYSQNSSQNNSFGDTYNSFQQEQMQLVALGRKKAKIIGIAAIVLDVIETLFSLSLRNILVTVLRIVFIIQFMNGSNSSRVYTAFLSVLRVIMTIISIAQVNSLSSEFAEYGLSVVITITQLILFTGIIANGVIIYFTLLDKSVKEFTVNK